MAYFMIWQRNRHVYSWSESWMQGNRHVYSWSESWMQGNRWLKFRTVVSEVSSVVGNPVWVKGFDNGKK